MFLRFTKRRLNITYSHNIRNKNNGGRFYGLHERYVKLGSEGIAAFLVSAILLSEASPSVNQCRLNDRELAALKIALRKVLEWMRQHSFHPELINSYRKVVEKWEESRRFNSPSAG
jgi:hypothetical protein